MKEGADGFYNDQNMYTFAGELLEPFSSTVKAVTFDETICCFRCKGHFCFLRDGKLRRIQPG